MRLVSLLILSLASGACSSDPCEGYADACIAADLMGNAASLDKITFAVDQPRLQSREADLPAPIVLPTTVALLFPRGTTSVLVEVRGSTAGTVTAFAVERVTFPESGHTRATFTLNGFDPDLGRDAPVADLLGADLIGADLSDTGDMVKPPDLMDPPDLMTFAGSTPYALTAGVQPVYVAVGDVTGDGKLDVVATGNTGATRIFVFPGQGNGTLGSPVTTALADSIELAVGTFNSDARSDVLVGRLQTANTNALELLISNGDGTFGGPTSYLACFDTGTGCAAGGRVGYLNLANFNGDAFPDVVAAQYGKMGGQDVTNVSVLLGAANGTFTVMGPYRANNVLGTGPNRMTVGDFNADAKTDLAIGEMNGKVDIVLGNGDGTFQAGTQISASSGGTAGLAVGDFDSDNKLDLAVGDGDKVAISLGNGNGTFKPYTLVPAGGMMLSIVADDFNQDGKRDIAVPNHPFGTITVLLSNGNGTFQTRTVGGGTNPNQIVSGDLNGDGKPDLVFTDGMNVRVMLNTLP